MKQILFADDFRFILTNTNSYGFTSCFYKNNDQYLISSYNIDDALSTINGKFRF